MTGHGVTIGGCPTHAAWAYNDLVRSPSLPPARSLAPRALAVACLLAVGCALAPVTLAADPTAATGGSGAQTAYDPTADRAIPYVVALLVTSAGLTTVGLVTLRLQRPPASRRRPEATRWWACETCGSRNQGDRAGCVACDTPRAAPGQAPAGDAYPA